MAVDVGEVRARITGDEKGLVAALSRAEQRLTRTGKRMKEIGSGMTAGITLPMVAIGGAAIKAATNFDREMTKIVTLVGVAEEQVSEWREEILKLAPAVGRGPTELSKALFAVTSAGQRGSEALQIVESAAKASAIGLGDTREVALAVTAAMKAYGAETLDATRATEIMIATVRAGNLEASDLAGTLGRVIGIASQLGVTFEEVGTFIATFTRLGVKADEAVTSLRGILGALLKGGKQAEAALADLGSSSAQLRQEVREKGLTRAMLDLLDAFNGETDAIRAVIPNIRALSGVLGSFAAQGGEIEGILRDIEQSMGIMGEGFERSLETMGQGFAMFRAELEVTAIQLGNELGPAFLDILNAMRPVLAAITDMIAAFGKLPQPIQTTVIAALALATAIGPILFLVGNLTTAFGGLLRVALPLIGFLGPVGLAGVLGFAAVGMLTLREETVELTDATKELKNQTSELTGKLEDLTAAQLGQVAASIAGRIANVRAQIAELTTAVDEAERKIASMQARPMGGVVTVDPAGLREQQQAAQDASDAIANLRAQEDALRQSIIDVGLKVKEAVAAQDALNASRTTGAGSSEADKERLDAIGEALSQLSEELRAAQVQAGLFGDEFDLLDETAKSFESAIQELAPLVRDAGEALNLTKEQAAGLEQVLGDVEIAGADLFQSIINDAVRAADNIDLAKISVADLQRVLDSLGGAAPVGAGLFGAFGAGAEGAAAGAGRALAVLLDSARAAGVEVDAATMTVRDLTAAMLAVDGTALDVVLGQLRAAGVEADAATGSVGDFTAALAAVGDVETALEGLLAGVADSLDLSSTSVDQLAASLSAVDAATLDRIVAAAEGAGLAIDTSTTSVESFLGALSAVSGAGANLDNLIASAQAAGVAIDLDTMSVREFAQALAEIGGTPAFLDLTQQLGGLAEGLDVSRLSLRMFREMIVGLGVDTAIFDSLIEKLRTANTDFDTTTGTVGDFMLALTDSGIAIGALEAVMADGKVTLEEFAAAYRTMKDALADTAAADRNADAIDKIIEKLETAKATYGMTSEEIEIWKLEQMGADRALTEKAQALQADIALLNQEAAATKAAAEAAEQLKEADLAATMQLINTVADRTAGGILEAFEGIVDGSKSVAEAIGDMVTSILRDLARLMIQQQLTGLFMQVLTSFLPGGGGGSVAAAQSPGGFFPGPHLQHGGYVPRGSVALVGENGPELVSTVAGGARVTSNAELAGMVSGGAGRGVTVAQTINYNLSAIDGRNAAEFLRSNAGVIARIQQEAARQSLQHVQRTTR